MSTNLIIQYIIVGVILLGVAIWVAWKIYHIRKSGAKSCCGCSLGDSCPNKAKFKSKDCKS